MDHQKHTFCKKTLGIWCGRWALIKTNTCRKFSGTIPPESRKEITLAKTNINNVIKISFSSTYNHRDHGRCHHRKYDKYVWAKVRATIYITSLLSAASLSISPWLPGSPLQSSPGLKILDNCQWKQVFPFPTLFLVYLALYTWYTWYTLYTTFYLVYTHVWTLASALVVAPKQ